MQKINEFVQTLHARICEVCYKTTSSQQESNNLIARKYAQ